MTRGDAIQVLSETLVNVMAGRAVFVEENTVLYDALLLLTQQDAAQFARNHARNSKVWGQRGYHGADGWPVPVR